MLSLRAYSDEYNVEISWGDIKDIMKLIWMLHLLGAFIFLSLCALFFLPDEKIPSSLQDPRTSMVRTLTGLVERNLPSDRESVQLQLEDRQKKHQKEIEELKARRSRLQDELRKAVERAAKAEEEQG